MMKIIFLSLFQAFLVLASGQDDNSETDSNPASPILPDINGQIEYALRQSMEIPRTTETQALIWIDTIHQIADRFLAEITMIKPNEDKLVFRPGNPRRIKILSFDTPHFTIEFDN